MDPSASGDLVMVELEHERPQVVYRWWHTTVVSVKGDQVEVSPPPSGGQRHPMMRLPARDRFTPDPGDRIFCTKHDAVDFEVGGEPVC